MSSIAFCSAVSTATSVRITRVGELNHRRRGKTPSLVVLGAATLKDLLRCLEVDDQSFAEQMALMTPGVLDLNFLAGHRLLATVSYLYPDVVRWSGWTSDARLARPGDLVAWLVSHGWRAPLQ